MTYLRREGGKFQLGSRDQLAIEICPLAPTWIPRHLPERTMGTARDLGKRPQPLPELSGR